MIRPAADLWCHIETLLTLVLQTAHCATNVSLKAFLSVTAAPDDLQRALQLPSSTY